MKPHFYKTQFIPGGIWFDKCHIRSIADSKRPIVTYEFYDYHKKRWTTECTYKWQYDKRVEWGEFIFNRKDYKESDYRKPCPQKQS